MSLEERVAELEDTMVIQTEKIVDLVDLINKLVIRVAKLEPPATGGRRNRSLRKRERRRNRSRKH